ncbi:hypothetical protein D3729_21380 [Vibrio parahaemolyticus]|nr:hypothetical protein [Vibrio parahaemolyticus]
MPFYVQDRFYNYSSNIERVGIAVTGTYHDYCPLSVDFGIYNRGRTTLHPVRHEISNLSLDSNFKIKLGLYENPHTLRALIVKLFSYGQKEYFSFDIQHFYNEARYALVAGEGNGAIAIGALEALASGCIPLLTRNEVKGLGLSEKSYVEYETVEDIKEQAEILLNNFSCNYEALKKFSQSFNYNNSKSRFSSFLMSCD